jgi:hypothetical protein
MGNTTSEAEEADRGGLEDNWHREMDPEVAQKYLTRKEMLFRVGRSAFIVIAITAPFFICITAPKWKKIAEDGSERSE